MAEIQRLTEEEVLAIRRRMATLDIATQDAFGLTEPVHPDRLASAVFRQYTSAGGLYKYRTIPEVGANLFYGVAMSHAFENGNKRTALVSLLVFLDKNKTLLVDAGENDLYELARSVAAHEILLEPGFVRNAETEAHAVADWLCQRLREKILGDVPVQFKELRAILEGLGCEFDRPDGNYIKIRNGVRVVKTGYPKANFAVPVGEVKRIRKYLALDEIHGVDSAGFYALEEKVDDFVNIYRNLMKRLADL